MAEEMPIADRDGEPNSGSEPASALTRDRLEML